MDDSVRCKLTSEIVIPARLHSTRLPEKLLLRETGKPLIQHTYESACRAKLPTRVTVATDHLSIFQAVRTFGGNAIMTDPGACCGTDRVAEVARQSEGVDVFVNVQGDEPDISADAIDSAIRLLDEHPQAVMSTLATPIRQREKLEDPDCVKVVFDDLGRALYFSRSPIPYVRHWNDELLSQGRTFFQHVGLYAYRRDFLLQLAAMKPSELEQLECLEQLRVLSTGHTILVGNIDEPAIGIDTRADYDCFVASCRRAEAA